MLNAQHRRFSNYFEGYEKIKRGKDAHGLKKREWGT
jgi:hypothetical protein